jgi:hypothetical protein
MALKKKEEVILTPKAEVASVNNDEMLLLETRKVKALEKIANSIDALTVWFEEIDKDEWSQRLQWYLAEWHSSIKKPTDTEVNE